MTGVCQGGAAGVSKQSREIVRQNAKTNSVGSNQTALGAADHSLVQNRRYDNDCRRQLGTPVSNWPTGIANNSGNSSCLGKQPFEYIFLFIYLFIIYLSYFTFSY